MKDRELAAMHSKLVIYRTRLREAKAKGDLDQARQWLEGIADLKKKIRNASTDPPRT